MKKGLEQLVRNVEGFLDDIADAVAVQQLGALSPEDIAALNALNGSPASSLLKAEVENYIWETIYHFLQAKNPSEALSLLYYSEFAVGVKIVFSPDHFKNFKKCTLCSDIASIPHSSYYLEAVEGVGYDILKYDDHPTQLLFSFRISSAQGRPMHPSEFFDPMIQSCYHAAGQSLAVHICANPDALYSTEPAVIHSLMEHATAVLKIITGKQKGEQIEYHLL